MDSQCVRSLQRIAFYLRLSDVVRQEAVKVRGEQYATMNRSTYRQLDAVAVELANVSADLERAAIHASHRLNRCGHPVAEATLT